MKRSRLARRTPLVNRTPLRRLTELRRTPRPASGASGGEVPEGGAPRSRSRGSSSHFLRAPAAVIRERSGGVCEIQLDGCRGRASQKSHRIGRQMGGRHGAARQRSDRPSNAMDACWWCHGVITESPGMAKIQGWVLEEWQNPLQEPVLYRREVMYLRDDGAVVSFAKAGA